MLSNGEFGERLARQAVRFGLKPRIPTLGLGTAVGPRRNRRCARRRGETFPKAQWVWGVHQESSTGVLNDLPELARIARHMACVCADCISSLGSVPLDLADSYLATGPTGKPCTYAGAGHRICRSKDTGTARSESSAELSGLAGSVSTRGPRYTFPSPILLALDAALEPYSTPDLAEAAYAMPPWVSTFGALRKLGLDPLAAERCASARRGYVCTAWRAFLRRFRTPLPWLGL